jgi:hypothetical protein
MVEGPIDDLDDPDEGTPDEGTVLSPEELDITESEHVEQLEEGRFVVSSDARVPEQSGSGSQPRQAGGSSTESGSDTAPEPEPEAEPTQQPRQSKQPQQSTNRKQTELSQEAVHQWLRQSFAENPSRYGFDVTATFDGSVSQRRMASNDVVTIFESLLLWYAQQVDSDTPVEEILGILLVESSVPVRYPPQSLKGLVKSSDLGPEDTIADLLAAVNEEDGVKL